MKKSLIIGGVVVIVVAIVAVMVFKNDLLPIQKNSDKKTTQEATKSSNPLDPGDYTKGANTGQTVDATDQNQVTVKIDEFVFKTTFLKIKKDTTVIWMNDGKIRHNVVSNQQSDKTGLDGPLLGNGETFQFTFNEAGVYEYFCGPHPTQMRGVVTVI